MHKFVSSVCVFASLHAPLSASCCPSTAPTTRSVPLSPMCVTCAPFTSRGCVAGLVLNKWRSWANTRSLHVE
ncbi:hypothetical protein PF007_g32555 [Phytophthora fragariae]|nr:hypothetical protein PF007_g32555 [Phytophthora fragariae]KAE9057114.1 hypothetical protein PF006_g32511 [Phytophthora fragariae]KAE9262974.1 hypothetical protein PF001_g31861 [Phytophthora fragariae]